MNKTNVTKLFRKFTETGKISDYLEYAKVKKDYLECKKVATNFAWLVSNFISKFRPEKDC